MHPNLLFELRDEHPEPLEVRRRSLCLFVVRVKSYATDTATLQACTRELLNGSQRSGVAFSQLFAGSEHLKQRCVLRHRHT
jgi:hypothetical protein